MEWILGIATLLGGIAAIWFFWDKIWDWSKPKPGLKQDLIEELQYNDRILRDIKYSTAPALRTEVWKSAAAQAMDIPAAARSQLGTIYRNMEGAKEIHRSIQAVPPGSDTTPELIRIEEMLLEAKRTISTILSTFKN